MGSVLPGYRVVATGDVFISRNVRGARVLASGGISVNGMVGPSALLDAVGSISVLQATDARLVAGLDIEVRTAAERSDLVAGRRVVFSERPGLLMGGRVSAGVGLEAVRIECAGGEKPQIRLGADPFVEVREELVKRYDFAVRHAEVIPEPSTVPPEQYLSKVAARRAHKNLTESIQRRLDRLGRFAGRSDSPYLRVSGRGTVRAVITLGSAAETQTNEPAPLVAVVEEGAVALRSLKEAVRVG